MHSLYTFGCGREKNREEMSKSWGGDGYVQVTLTVNAVDWMWYFQTFFFFLYSITYHPAGENTEMNSLCMNVWVIVSEPVRQKNSCNLMALTVTGMWLLSHLAWIQLCLLSFTEKCVYIILLEALCEIFHMSNNMPLSFIYKKIYMFLQLEEPSDTNEQKAS